MVMALLKPMPIISGVTEHQRATTDIDILCGGL
jgi:hypothetical protein